MCRFFADKGYFAGTGGNIGVRLDEIRFAVTPSATDYYTITAADVAVLRLDTLEQLEGTKPASIEQGLHSKMLTLHPTRLASVHTHQPIASAAALLHEILPWPPNTDRRLFGDHIGLVPYRPSGTKMLSRAFSKALRPDLYAYLLASHGVICAAPTLDAAAEMIARIEAAAAHFLKNLIPTHPGSDKHIVKLARNCLDAACKEDVNA